MYVRRFIIAGLLSLGLWPVGARAADTGACSLTTEYQVTSVGPYRAGAAGYYYTPELRGAELHVAALPGLTGEWLQRQLQSEVASGACDFGAPNAKVSVLSAGGGFSVTVTSPDDRSAKAILAHANELSPRHRR